MRLCAMEDVEDKKAFDSFCGKADLVICDTMYPLAETITLKADRGHPSKVMAVNLCHGGAGKPNITAFLV